MKTRTEHIDHEAMMKRQAPGASPPALPIDDSIFLALTQDDFNLLEHLRLPVAYVGNDFQSRCHRLKVWVPPILADTSSAKHMRASIAQLRECALSARLIPYFKYGNKSFNGLARYREAVDDDKATRMYLESILLEDPAQASVDLFENLGAEEVEVEGVVWPDPLPLPDDLLPVKNLEPEMLPDPLRGWIMDIADRMQIPPDFSAAAAIVALGSIIGRGCGIYPKRHDDWVVVPNLWGGVIGRPSLMKSPAVTEALKPLARLEAEARGEYEKEIRAYEIEAQVGKLKQGIISDSLKKALKSDDKTIIEQLKNQMEAFCDEPPARRRFQTQDATIEKIGELLNQNPRGLLISRDELVGWLKTLEREGREGDRAVYLEAWNGTRGFSYDRIGRGTLDIPSLCISIFGTITPGPLQNYVYQAIKGGKGDDGLLQRFQVFVWPDAPGEWKNIDRFPDTKAKARAWGVFKALAEEIPGAVIIEDAEIPAMRFTPAGQEIFDAWREELEKRLRGDHGLHAAMESHLVKYRSLMPSLALVFHLVDVAASAAFGQVSDRAAAMAADWCEYLESHAGRIYGGATMPGMEEAREILKHIRRGAIQDRSTIRSIWRPQWSRLTSPEEVRAGLAVLEQYGWLAVEKRPSDNPTGGRPSEVIKLNPRIKL